MKLIERKVKLLPQDKGLDGIYRQIEIAGRTCYKSKLSDTIEGTKKFVESAIHSGHYSILEHGTVYLMFILNKEPRNTKWKKLFTEETTFNEFMTWLSLFFSNNPYSRFAYDKRTNKYCITTNMRVIVENSLEPLLDYICKPTTLHPRRYTFRFNIDRGVWNEFIRHKVISRTDDCFIDYDMEKNSSFSQESTRYCNYSKDKFGNELQFIIPHWCKVNAGHYYIKDNYIYGDGYAKNEIEDTTDRFILNCLYTESDYFDLLNKGLAPEDARGSLTNWLATELVMTAFEDDWQHFFDLRYWNNTGKAHPDAIETCRLMLQELNLNGIGKFNKF